jgi:hypothetical protein
MSAFTSARQQNNNTTEMMHLSVAAFVLVVSLMSVGLATTVTVVVRDFQFVPANITICTASPLAMALCDLT